MLWLPELRRRGRSWRLGVSEQGAASLAWCLLQEADERAKVFQATLGLEPGLALWICCQIGEQPAKELSIIDLANWLADESEALFVGCTYSGLPADETSPSAFWPDASVACVGVARAAAGSSDPASSPAYLLGLLHLARECLAASELGANKSRLEQSDCLPGWLVAALRDLDSNSPVLAPALAVLAARERLTTRPMGTRGRNAIRRRWSESPAVPSLAAALPRIVELHAQLTQLRDDFQRTLEQEKLASMRQLAYGASHEINNPLANISTRAQALLRDEQDPDRRRKLATISAQAFRAHEMISDMMLFAKPPAPVIQPFSVAQWFDELVGELRREAAAREIELIDEVSADCPDQIEADGEQLAVAVGAVVRNSIEALDLGGEVRITLREATGPAGESFEVAVEDTGPGVSDEVRRHLFDPFFSGREAGRGLGLGLSKCWRIITLHGGSVETDNLASGGARFTLRVPISSCPSIRTAG